MCELAADGVAILMISSELPEVLGMSDRVLVMREGRLVAEFDRAHATSEAVGAAMMGADPDDGAGRMSAIPIGERVRPARQPPQALRLAGGAACGRRDRPCDRGRLRQSALPRLSQSRRHPARQRLYRDRRHRHVDGDHLRQYRHLGRRADRRARDAQRLARGRRRADRRHLARPARARRRRDGGAGRRRRLSPHSGDRRDARHAVDPQGRPHQRHRRQMDHRPAAELPSRRPFRARRADAGRHHGRGDRARRALDALFAERAARSTPPAATPKRRGCAASIRSARS